eukprot:SAG11_NODE_16839_length_536_cov_0.583524_1_plen_21_part_10
MVKLQEFLMGCLSARDAERSK